MADYCRKRIAFLLSSLKCGGAERVALNLATALSEMGAQVEILLMSKEGEFLPEAERLFRVVDLECDRTFKLPAKLLSYLLSSRPDVVISSFWKINLCACIAKMLYPSTILILWEHSPPSKSVNSPTWLYAISASILYRAANSVVTVSNGVLDDVSRITVGLGRRLTVIFNAIKPPAPATMEKVAGRDPGRRKIISVGRLESVKNPRLLIEAFALLPLDCMADLIIVGDGSLREQLERLCTARGLGGRVKFAGYQEDPYAFMVVSDLLVVSSVYEGLSNVVIEALYCGLSVVSTNCGQGVCDILMDGKYGRIVPPNDKQALAGAMEAELETRRSCKTQQAGASRFQPRDVAKQFITLIDNCRHPPDKSRENEFM